MATKPAMTAIVGFLLDASPVKGTGESATLLVLGVKLALGAGAIGAGGATPVSIGGGTGAPGTETWGRPSGS